MADDAQIFGTMWSMGFGNMNDALFGKKDRDESRVRALASDWETHRMPRTKAHMDISIELSTDEFETLAWGHIPHEMEDHWFMYFSGAAFCFYRSWTGYCIYKIYVRRKDPNTYELYRITANRSEKQYGETNDERDAVMATILVYQALGMDASELWEKYFEMA